MSASGFQTSCLRDDRLAPLATSALPGLALEHRRHAVSSGPIRSARRSSERRHRRQIGARKFDPGQLSRRTDRKHRRDIAPRTRHPGSNGCADSARASGAPSPAPARISCLPTTRLRFSWSRPSVSAPTCRWRSDLAGCSPAATNRWRRSRPDGKLLAATDECADRTCAARRRSPRSARKRLPPMRSRAAMPPGVWMATGRHRSDRR